MTVAAAYFDNFSPKSTIKECTQFLNKIYKIQGNKSGIIAVSGGIDSAVSLSLLTHAIGRERVHALLLPYGDQDMTDAETAVKWNKIPANNIQTIAIKPMVDSIAAALQVTDPFRLGNIMARVRMIVLYDQAKKLDALVCGTENKSEKYLGYFTRFGDEASDIEPIHDLYKTQIRQVAQALELPPVFVAKSPSAGLWQNQTDENELGFSYQAADEVLHILIDHKAGVLYLQLIEGNRLQQVAQAIHEQLPDLAAATITAVLERVRSQQFKHEVPYSFSNLG